MIHSGSPRARFSVTHCLPRWAVLVAFGLIVATVAPAKADPTLDRIREGQTVTVAIADEAPYGYRDASGRVTGEAPEIAREILQCIDPAIDITFVSSDFGNLIPGLRDGRFDIAAAGMFITPTRCRQVAFSNPTYIVGEAFLVRTGNPKGIVDYPSISDNPDARVGLIAGTVEYNYALVAGVPADQAPLYRNFGRAVQGLKEGEVDAVGLTSLTARGLAAEEPNLEATAQFYPEVDGEVVKGYGGFAFRLEDTDLVAAFNDHLGEFLGTDAHWRLVEPFGFGPDMQPDRTAQELCAG